MMTLGKFRSAAVLIALMAGCSDGDDSRGPGFPGDEPGARPESYGATCWTWEEYDQETEDDVIQTYCGRRWGRAYYQYESNGCITVTIQCYSDGGYVTS